VRVMQVDQVYKSPVLIGIDVHRPQVLPRVAEICRNPPIDWSPTREPCMIGTRGSSARMCVRRPPA